MKLFFKYLIGTPWKEKKFHLYQYKSLGVEMKRAYSEMRDIRSIITRYVDDKHMDSPCHACFKITKHYTPDDYNFVEYKCLWMGCNDVCINAYGKCPHRADNRLYCERRQRYEQLQALRKQFWKTKFEQVQNKK